MSDQAKNFFDSKITTMILLAAIIGGAGIFLLGGSRQQEQAQTRPAIAQAETALAPTPEATPTENLAAASSAPSDEDATGEPQSAPETENSATQKVSAGEPEPTPAPAEAAPVRRQPPPPDPVQLALAADARGANSFNRLMKRPSSAPNAPPARDGIHDAANPGTELLQWPSVAFEGMPRTSDGNKIDWVGALDSGQIAPRYEVDDPNAEPFLLDLVIVRQVKGSMPNVVYPHLQHTQWLDCSNCHDEIFTPQKGANQISMAGILLGQKCGVCHGKVAFPVSDCRRCHSQPKTEEELRALADRSNWATGGGQ